MTAITTVTSDHTPEVRQWSCAGWCGQLGTGCHRPPDWESRQLLLCIAVGVWTPRFHILGGSVIFQGDGGGRSSVTTVVGTLGVTTQTSYRAPMESLPKLRMPNFRLSPFGVTQRSSVTWKYLTPGSQMSDELCNVVSYSEFGKEHTSLV